MNFHILYLHFVFLILVWCPFRGYSKSVDIFLSSEEAKKETGQFLTTFTFTTGGHTVIKYRLAEKAKLEPRIHVFSWELMPRRRRVTDSTSCRKFFDIAVSSFRLKNTTGVLQSGSYTGPFRVVILYSDALTCGGEPPKATTPPSKQPPKPPVANAADSKEVGDGRALLSVREATTKGHVAENKHLLLHMELFNVDSFGKPTNHFGAEEIGLLGFFQFITISLIIIGCISVPKLWPHLAPGGGGSMRSVIALTSAIAGLQFLSYLLMLIHLRHYSINGIEGRFCEGAAELLDLCCQFLMLHLLLCWSFAARRHEERVWWSGSVARAVVVLAVIQIITFIFGEIIYPSDAHVYHNYNGPLQLLLLLVRVVLAASFALYLLKASKRDRSAIKRDFFTLFAKICLVWFLCYPVIYVLASLWREYTRYKFTTMTVCLCQTTCLFMLFRLFLSRSLFWEVSALSGTLPIVMKFDKKYGLKASP